MIVVMAGGGTGGHVIPAIAVAQELRRRGHDPIFFGTRHGYEARLAPAAGFPVEWIQAGALNRAGAIQKLKSLLQLPLSTRKIWSFMRRQAPGAVFNMGGYVAGPVVLAAVLGKVPLVTMEPNVVPGLTNRRAARWTARALVNFEETAKYFPPGRTEVTGVPVREEFFAVGHKQATPDVFTVLVTGGSQGSRTLNKAASASWRMFAEQRRAVRFLHQAGRGNAEGLAAELRDAGLDGEVVEFINDMPAAFAQADLIVCRSGASTVSELAAAGKPSVLVPFPYAADNHQYRNAEAMQRAGAARLITDAEMNGNRFFSEINGLLLDHARLLAMGENARKLAKPGAAERAADVLQEVANPKA